LDVRIGLYDLAAQHGLEGKRIDALLRLAGFNAEPAGAPKWMPRVLAAVGGALLGLGIVFWVAANWDAIGRFGKFALLMGLVLVMCIAAWARPGAARAPLTLVAMLSTGGLFAFFGQTYQTGADPWQLFALWATLALPLALAARSDIVWAPWAVVAMCAVSLWIHAHTAYRWRFELQDLGVHLIGWALACAVVAGLSPLGHGFTGARQWSFRTALLLATIVVTGAALGGLLQSPVTALYPLGLLLIGVAAAAVASGRGFDIVNLSALTLAANVLLVAGIARWVLDGHQMRKPIAEMLILGLAAAGLLAGSVSLVVKLWRKCQPKDAE
jgi:uncharacterized membrane protein